LIALEKDIKIPDVEQEEKEENTKGLVNFLTNEEFF